MAAAQASNKRSASPEVATKDSQEHLESLINRAAAKDAIKDYNAAAELYSEATELQAKLNGELSLGNADLLFAYGKALYNVAVSKSDVLGSKVAGNTQPSSSTADNTESIGTSENLIQNAIAGGTAREDTEGGTSQPENTQNKPLFQFTGDENFDVSDSEEEDDGNAAAADDEEDDDFANAFEVLDLARILYHKKLSAVEEEGGKGKSTGVDPDIKDLKERLADTYDLQAEISLEAERFTDAVSDLRTALEFRQSLFPMEDPAVAECHYKLSLALEFGSVKIEEGDSKLSNVEEEMRKEAVTHMEKAIESCRVRMAQEQKKLDEDSSLDEDKTTAAKRKIANVKEIVTDMEQRLVDLRRPPGLIETGYDDKSESMLKGILGQIMGQPPGEQQSRLDAATKNANDLSAFVKKRKPGAGQSSQQNTSSSSSKRPAQEEIGEGDAKKARSG